ncbi:hypothetical protein MASR2M79_11190 [Aminivibrio sp.]
MVILFLKRRIGRPFPPGGRMKGGKTMDSVYKIIELVGTSSESWEEAAANGGKASKT